MNPVIEQIASPPDIGIIEEIQGSLNLREPNARAIRTIAHRLNEFYATRGEDSDAFFEGVVDSATGMGKSFIIAGAIDYFSAQAARNFAIVTPGSAIQDKTINQFTPGHPKSLLGGMMVEPLLVHSGNFDSASMASAFADQEQVKLFVFTIQSLLKPGTKQGRKTHEYKEGLGKAFYGHLDSLDDLIIFADEHHCYGGEKFSKALRSLTPLALVGLTATPDEKAMKKTGVETIFQYPLAAAISDGYVKTPVIVGRKDDIDSEKMQLLDGGILLRAKENLLKAYSAETGEPVIHPIMLVSCQDIDHAQDTVAFLRSEQFFDGDYAGENVVLEVHSSQTDEALKALDQVEDPESPTRIIVQVGMLKEGWDVKNVYVIASLRSSVSEVLTEQTLGRGLRLPFGAYVQDPEYQLLNELEVVSHERYRELLQKAGKLSQAFIDYQTVVEESGETTEVEVGAGVDTNGAGAPGSTPTPGGGHDRNPHHVIIRDGGDRVKEAEDAAKPKVTMELRRDLPAIRVPLTRATPVAREFSLASITEGEPFRELGRKLAVDPEKYLRRTVLQGEISEGGRSAKLNPEGATTKVMAADALAAPEDGRQLVLSNVVGSRVVTARKGEAAQVERLLDLVLDGAGDQSKVLLTRYARRLSEKLVELIELQKKDGAGAKTQYEMVVKDEPFEPRARFLRSRTSTDHYGDFNRASAYTGWKSGLFEQAWFDSSPEREIAAILDEDDAIEVWVRLHIGDLPILWNGANQSYNPDFLALDKDGTRWVIEAKSDREMTSEEVQEKRKAAITWANTVNGSGGFGTWRYLLVSESDLKQAQGSWSALAKLAGG